MALRKMHFKTYSPSKKMYFVTLSVIHISVIVATIIILTMLLIASSAMFVKSVSVTEGLAAVEKQDEVSVNDGVDLQDLYLAKSMEMRIAALEKNQDNALADIRQETNNIINKFNGWIGFWIAILAIFGGVIPIVLQYILRQKSKKEIHDMFETLQCRALDHQMQLMVTSVELDHEMSIVSNSSKRDEFIKTLTNETNKYMGELIDILDNKQGFLSREAEMHIITGLVQYCKLVEILKVNASGSKLRSLKETLDKIKTLIVEILNHKENTRADVWNKLMDLIPQLYSLT